MDAAIAAGEEVTDDASSIRKMLEEDAVSYDVYINPHVAGLEYTVFSQWGNEGNEEAVREMIEAAELVDGTSARVEIPDILTDDDVYLALMSDFDEVSLKSNGHLTFTTEIHLTAKDENKMPYKTGETQVKAETREGWDPDTAHCHFENGAYALVPQPYNTDKIYGSLYEYWSPAADNDYGCYDRMIIEKEGLVSLAEDVLTADDRNRVAYVGFCKWVYPGQSTEAFLSIDDWDELEAIMGNINGHNYTNYVDAMNDAARIIATRGDEDNARPCYVIFVSDGMPTESSFGYDTAYDCFDILSKDGEDFTGALTTEILALDKSAKHKEAALTMSDAFKDFLAVAEDEDTPFFTVGFSTNEEASDLLETMATSEDDFFNCADADAFLEAMDVILENLPSYYPSGVLSDEIGADFDLLVDEDHPFVVDDAEYESADAAVEAGVTIDGANLAWNLENVDEEGVQISFYVQVDDLTKYNDLLPTNADTDEATGANLAYNKLVKDDSVAGYHEEDTNIPMETLYLQMTSGQKMSELTMLEADQETVVPVGKGAEDLILPTEQGTMTAQKWGTFATDADAEDGIVNVSFDIAGEALEVPGPLDLIVIADESGSLNMYGRADVKANANSPTTSASYMPCLNKDHYYMVKGLQYELNQIAGLRGLTIPEGTEDATADAAAFITPHGVAADGVDLAYTVFGHWGKYPALVRTMIDNAGVVIPDGMTDDDVFRALFSDWDAVALNSKGKLTFTNLVGWTPDKNHYHEADIDSEIPYVVNNETVAETGELYSYWSPAADNAYSCYDRMMIEKEGVAGLVDKIYSQHWDNRVAYVGFTYSAYPSLSSNNISGADSGFCAATNINYAAGGDAPAALMEVIDNTSGHDYTNYAHALWTAKKMIDDRADKTRPVYVVFISDGVPTRTSSATANTWNILEAPVQGGSDGDCLGFNEIYYGETDYTHETAAMYVAAQFRAFLKETVAEYEFYTVGFNTNASADALLDDMDNNGFYDCADSAAFLKAMEGIRQDIIMVDPDGVLYDEIGADFDFIIDESHPLTVTAKEYNAENAKWELTTATYISLEAAEANERLTFTYVDGKVTAISVALEDVTTAEVSFYEQLKEKFIVPDTSYANPYMLSYYETNETDATLTYHKLVLDKTAEIGYKAEESASVVEMKTPWVRVEGYYVNVADLADGTAPEEILESLREIYAAANAQMVLLCYCAEEHDCCDHSDEDYPVAYMNETGIAAVSTMSLRSAAPDDEEETSGAVFALRASAADMADEREANRGNDKDNFGVGQLKHDEKDNKNGSKHLDCDHGHEHDRGEDANEEQGIIVCDCKCKECEKKFDVRPENDKNIPDEKDGKDRKDNTDKDEPGKKSDKKR